MVRVLLFGALADIAGWRERDMEASAIADVRERLASDDPALGEALDRPGVQVALDRALVRGNSTLGPRAEVAFLPPMSGG